LNVYNPLRPQAEDVSFSSFTVSNPTTDLILQKCLGLVSYFDGVNYKDSAQLNDLFSLCLTGQEVYRISLGGFSYYALRVNGNQFNIYVREPNKRMVTVRADSYELIYNPFYGANPRRFSSLFGMASNGVGRRLDSQGQIKVYWHTKVASGLKEVWDRLRERLTRMTELAKEFRGMTVVSDTDKITQMQPDYSGSVKNDGELAIDIALAEYGMPRELLYGTSNEVSLITFIVQKIQPLIKQHSPNATFNRENFVAYISTTGKEGALNRSQSNSGDSKSLGNVGQSQNGN
jgi:hypothetical protein